MPKSRLKQHENPNHHLFKRNDWWWCEYVVGGERRREPLRTTDVAVARQERDKLIAVAEAIRSGRPLPITHTWRSAVGEWLSYMDTSPKLTPNTYKRYQVSVAQWGMILGDDCPLDTIDEGTILDFVKARREEDRAASTIRNDLTALSRVLRYSKSKKWIPTNPAEDFDRDEHIGRDADVLNPPDDLELAADLPDLMAWRHDMRDLFLFLRQTGMRLSEALHAERRFVHPCGELITLMKGTKGSRPRTVHLGRAAELLDRLPTTGRLFPGLHTDSAIVSTRYGQWRRQRQAREVETADGEARLAEELRRWRIHDLRHAYAIASILDDSECIYRLQQQLGHSSVKVTEKYLRFLDGRGAMRRYGRRRDLFGSLSDAKGSAPAGS